MNNRITAPIDQTIVEVSSVIFYCIRGLKIRRCLSQNRFEKPPLPASLSQNKGGMPVAVLDGNWLMRRVLEVHVLKSLTFLVCFGILQQVRLVQQPTRIFREKARAILRKKHQLCSTRNPPLPYFDSRKSVVPLSRPIPSDERFFHLREFGKSK